MSLIVSKLTEPVQRRWAETIVRQNIPVDDRFHKLLDFLELEIRTAEILVPLSSSQNRPIRHEVGSTYGHSIICIANTVGGIGY